ncbi:MAG: hypothetical protein V4580_03935 [Bacteroidota bacterium]
MKKIILRCAELSILDEHTIRVKLLDDIDIQEKDAEEVIKALKLLTKGNHFGLLTETINNFTATDEARNYMAKAIGKTSIIANAIYIRSLSIRLLINLYIRFHQPTVVTKIFNSEKSALDWLEGQRMEQETKQEA